MVGGSGHVVRSTKNLKAHDLGMRDTRFLDSTGLNPGNVNPWGNQSYQLWPNWVLLFWTQGFYYVYWYWPLAHNKMVYETALYFPPARTARACSVSAASRRMAQRGSLSPITLDLLNFPKKQGET